MTQKLYPGRAEKFIKEIHDHGYFQKESILLAHHLTALYQEISSMIIDRQSLRDAMRTAIRILDEEAKRHGVSAQVVLAGMTLKQTLGEK